MAMKLNRRFRHGEMIEIADDSSVSLAEASRCIEAIKHLFDALAPQKFGDDDGWSGPVTKSRSCAV